MTENLHKKMLAKAYKKSLKKLNKTFFTNKFAGIRLFAEYLRYMRDSLIIDYFDTTDYNTQLATIIAVVAEYDAYIASTDKTNKTFHWNNFCELLKQNMEDWLE